MKRLNARDIENAFEKIDAVFLNSPQCVGESLGEILGCVKSAETRTK
jgi:hypothetical protein